MSEFIPPPYPRPLAIGIFERDGHILVFEGHDSRRNNLTFYRPLGGGIEFGEHSTEALVREIQEELALESEVTGLLGVLENLFTHHGAPGHEIVFIHRARFLDPTVYHDDIPFAERNDNTHAIWVPVAEFLNGQRVLFPEGLTDLLQQLT